MTKQPPMTLDVLRVYLSRKLTELERQTSDPKRGTLERMAIKDHILTVKAALETLEDK